MRQDGQRGLHCLDKPCSSHNQNSQTPPISNCCHILEERRHIDRKQELEFLTDSSVISPQQLSSILSQLPPQTQLHAPVQSPIPTATQQLTNLSLNNEKNQYVPSPAPAPPPPAYASGPQVLALASALYAYTPTDAGDLALQQNDRVQVTEHMNIDCKPSFPTQLHSLELIQFPEQC